MNFGISNSAPFLIELGKRGVERYAFNLNPEFSDRPCLATLAVTRR